MMEFLYTHDDISGYILEPCKLDNPFHRSTLGCVIGTDLEGKLFHIFKHEDITLSRQSNTLYDYIDFCLDYVKEKFYDSSGYRFVTPIMRNMDSVENIARNRDVLRAFIKSQNELYVQVIKPNLKFDMDPQQLYDIMSINGVIRFYRPIRLTDNRRAFIGGQRQAFFELLRMFARSEQCRQAYIEKKQSVRERNICSAGFFVRRNAPAELKCEFASARDCLHISENSWAGKTILAKPAKLCRHLLQQMIEDHDENVVNQILGFSCCMVNGTGDLYDLQSSLDSNGDEILEVPLVFAFNFLYKRTAHIHRLCLPGYILNEAWYTWFLKLIDVRICM